MPLFFAAFALAVSFKGTCAKPVQCESATVELQGERATVSFSNGLSFAGERVGGDGPFFLYQSMSVDGKLITVEPGACHFYFTDHGTFTPGWESRLTAVTCDVRTGGTQRTINFQVAH